MDITSIRIQFVTLAKTIRQNKSVCYLEVIPNVTNVENIEKIEWKSENDKTEYILPINYKIILKKVDSTAIDESQKMYYSCVDLLQTPASSIHNVELGSGDVSRIVSDNNFVQNFATIRGKANEKRKITQKATKNCEQDLKVEYAEEKNEYSQNMATVMLEICKQKHIRKRSFNYFRDNVFDKQSNIISENLRFTAKKTTSVQIEISTEELKDYKSKRIVSEEFHAFEANITKPVSVETLTNFNAKLKNGSKLTVTSVISEEDIKFRPLLRTVYQNTSFCNTKSITKHTLDMTKNYTAKKSMTDFQQNTTDATRNIIARKSCKANILNPVISRFCSKYNITSALRLSNFIQLIEKEMLPLKITLNEIVNKCIPLGLPLKCKLLYDLETYEYDPRAIQKCNRRTQLPSNRGVYSVVFNKC